MGLRLTYKCCSNIFWRLLLLNLLYIHYSWMLMISTAYKVQMPKLVRFYTNGPLQTTWGLIWERQIVKSFLRCIPAHIRLSLSIFGLLTYFWTVWEIWIVSFLRFIPACTHLIPILWFVHLFPNILRNNHITHCSCHKTRGGPCLSHPS